MSLTHKLREWTAIHEQIKGSPAPLTPATDEVIAEVREMAGLELPEEFEELLRFSNGVPWNWPGDYEFFPGARFVDVRESLVVPRRISSGRPEHAPMLDIPGAAESSVQLFYADYLVAMVCDGPAKGAIWGWWGENGKWISRSLTDLVYRCLQYHHNGWLDWEFDGQQGVGCRIVSDVEVLNPGPYGFLDGPLPHDPIADPYRRHVWQWQA